MEEANCHLCNGVVRIATEGDRDVNLEDFSGSPPVWVETDGRDRYFRCWQCSAKNVFIVTSGRKGIPKIEVIRAVMEEY